jgi:hypothetical protein
MLSNTLENIDEILVGLISVRVKAVAA